MFTHQIREAIEQAVSNLQTEGVFGVFDIPAFAVDVPDDPQHGDYATNVALVLAKKISKNPMEVAAVLKGHLSSDLFQTIDLAPPGFVNFTLSSQAYEHALAEILEKGENIGDAMSGKSEKIQVEFISANPTGPLTLANGRGGFFGDVLARVLESQGYTVEREYYVNDAGNQIRTLGLSVLAAGGAIEGSEDYYHGEHIASAAQEFKGEFDEAKKDPEALGRKVAEKFLRTMIRPAVENAMGITFDRWTSEYEDIRKKGCVEKVTQLFRDKGLLYEKEGARWLKTTEFGDDKDRVLVTSDGFPTYFLVDAGHYLDTKERGFGEKVNIVGADHHGYVSRIQSVAQIVGLEKSEVVVMQLVRLVKEGEELRMSKRKGVFVTIQELVDEVGVDAVRFFFLEKNPETHIDFDVELAKKRSKENPVYYVQYAHTRVRGLIRKGAESPSKFVFEELQEEERSLARELTRLDEVLQDIASDHHVARLVHYVRNVAQAFHHFYEKSRILDAEEGAREKRLALLFATEIILKKSLGLLGIAAPEEM